MLNIGCHLSASKGFLNMGKTAIELGGNTFQFFTRNPRGGSAKDIDPEDAKALLSLMQENGFAKILAHAPYTLNACAKVPSIREFAYNTMLDDLKRMEYVPNNMYNFHPGSHVGQGVETGIELISDLLNSILWKEQTTTVLLETMAGKGSELGRSFEELAMIYDGVVFSDKLRVCFDTCHTSDAGYDIINDFDGVMDKFDKIIGKNQISVFHINDSKNVPGAAKDRHENIGFGNIGFDALLNIINCSDFEDIPKILETPYIKDPRDAKKSYAPYKHEIEMIRNGVFNSNMINEILRENGV